MYSQNCCVDRLVEAELEEDLVVGLGRRLVADDLQHRIDRHDAADEEGERRQPDQRDRHREEPGADVDEDLQRA